MFGSFLHIPEMHSGNFAFRIRKLVIRKVGTNILDK